MSEATEPATNGAVESRPVDALDEAFGEAIATLMENLPEGFVRKVAVTEIIAAHARAQERIARRRMN
jgi:hypothetical protein